MDIHARKTDDNHLELTFSGTPEELAEELGPSDAVEEVDEQGDTQEGLLGRKKYRCTCGNGECKTISASSSLSASAKCLERCKGPFSVSRGSC